MVNVDRSGDAFRQALDEILRRPQPESDEGGEPLSGPLLGARFDLGPTRGGGGEARWGLAMDWANEPPAPRAPPARAPLLKPAPASADIAEAVARELGFSAGLTPDALAKRWRAYLWRNHPDRQPAHARDSANARVAVANALYDQARRAMRRA